MAKTEEFGVCVAELIKWMAEEGKSFGRTERLLYCGMGMFDSLRAAKRYPADALNLYGKALLQAEEFQELFSEMAQLGIITEMQTKPLLSECRYIIEEIELLRAESDRAADDCGFESGKGGESG